MEILEKGTHPLDMRYSTTCLDCKTKFAFTPREAAYKRFFLIEIRCPVCNEAKVYTLGNFTGLHSYHYK